jgi:3-deoxy-D-manno-octulosonate 8-phosphate phosphatase KdsC-like HAD superfamily phosphatase
MRTIVSARGDSIPDRWDDYWRAAAATAAGIDRSTVADVIHDSRAVIAASGGAGAVGEICRTLLQVTRRRP